MNKGYRYILYTHLIYKLNKDLGFKNIHLKKQNILKVYNFIFPLYKPGSQMILIFPCAIPQHPMFTAPDGHLLHSIKLGKAKRADMGGWRMARG